jgi:hypothetical protein
MKKEYIIYIFAILFIGILFFYILNKNHEKFIGNIDLMNKLKTTTTKQKIIKKELTSKEKKTTVKSLYLKIA